MIAIPLVYPNLACYNEDGKAINLDEETSGQLIASAKACQSEFPYNPFHAGDYVGVFFFKMSIDPSITIIDLRRNGRGFRVAFHGYESGYTAVFYLSEDYEVVLADIKLKTMLQ